MKRDRLSTEERLDRTMRGKDVDRVPAAPLIHYFAAKCAGVTCADMWWDRKKYMKAMSICYEMVGPWDASFQIDAASPAVYTYLIPMKMLAPGRELSDNEPAQFLEEEIMKRHDYGWLIEETKRGNKNAFGKLLTKLVVRANSPELDGRWGTLKLLKDIAKQGLYYRQNIKRWKKAGVAFYYGSFFEAPFDTFACSRGFMPFVDDILEVPDLVRDAALAAVPSFVRAISGIIKITGVRRALIACHRTSNDFISPTMFKNLALPSLKAICDQLAEQDILPVLHCDGNWDQNAELLKELPEGKVTVQFDGATDIFRAREIIGNHLCFHGDVHPDMLFSREPEEVDAYCKRLIEEVGKDGGLIVGSGCEVPPNAKIENVRAMINSVRKYGYYS